MNCLSCFQPRGRIQTGDHHARQRHEAGQPPAHLRVPCSRPRHRRRGRTHPVHRFPGLCTNRKTEFCSSQARGLARMGRRLKTGKSKFLRHALIFLGLCCCLWVVTSSQIRLILEQSSCFYLLYVVLIEHSAKEPTHEFSSYCYTLHLFSGLPVLKILLSYFSAAPWIMPEWNQTWSWKTLSLRINLAKFYQMPVLHGQLLTPS